MPSSGHLKGAMLALIILTLVPCEPSFGQDFLAPHKIRGLKGLRDVAITLRPNALVEIASQKEWSDMVEAGLRREVPELGRLEGVPDLGLSEVQKTQGCIELSYITSKRGGVIELSVYRWVNVLGSGQNILAKVWWDSRYLEGELYSKKDWREAVDTLLTSFAADYSRAKN